MSLDATARTALAAVRLRDLLLDVIYPPRCGGCDRRGTFFCAECRASIVPTGSAAFISPSLSVISSGEFAGPLREAIHKLKYENDLPLARPLAGLLADALAGETPGLWKDAVLVPVPLHRRRERARDYNQSALLARELSLLLGLPVQNSLVRLRDTGSQVGRSGTDRRENVSGAFQWRGGAVPERVVLVDDVCTTGATLVACSSALYKAGARVVSAATVAKAVYRDKPDNADS